MIPRRALLAALLPGAAAAAMPVLRIGVLTDLAGPRAESSGLGSVEAARIAAAEMGGGGLGRTVEVLSADAGHSAEFAGRILRRWFDEQGVEAVVDVPDEAVALEVQRVCRARGKVALFCGALSTVLTNAECSPTGFHWTMDSYAVAGALAAAAPGLAPSGWFLLVVQEPIGRQLRRELLAVIGEGPGEAALDPAADPGEGLARARQSGAAMVVLCGGDAGLIRQAAAGLAPGQTLAATTLSLAGIQAMGLTAAQGILTAQPFYWDSDERSRAWAARFAARMGRMPDAPQIGTYSAVRHYLRAVGELGGSDGGEVAKRMRYISVEDAFSRGVRLRADGRALRPMLLARVKAPAESKSVGDCLVVLKTVPTEAVIRPIAQSQCRLLPGSAG